MAPRNRPQPPTDVEIDVVEGEVLTEEQYDLVRERIVPPRPRARADLDKPVGADGQLSGMDARLLSMAASHKSPEEMGEELSIPPLRAAQRVREILASHDWLTAAQQEQLVMQEMVELKDRLSSLVARFDDVDYLHGLDPRMIAMLQKMLTDLLKAIDQRRKTAAAERLTIRASHAKLVVSAIERAFRSVMHDLGKKYGIDELEARNALEAALPRAIEAIQAEAEPE